MEPHETGKSHFIYEAIVWQLPVLHGVGVLADSTIKYAMLLKEYIPIQYVDDCSVTVVIMIESVGWIKARGHYTS